MPTADPRDHDARITCAACNWLHPVGDCRAADSGLLVATARRYSPVRDLKRRCEAYTPMPHDRNQRTGEQRWPWLRDTLARQAARGAA